MSDEVTSERLAEFKNVVICTTQWAQDTRDIRAVGLAGSWARNSARVDSDVDFVVLTDRKDRYVASTAWIGEAAGNEARVVWTREWGPLTERRVALPSGFEVEYGFAPASWADTAPLDQGTASVVSDGFRILYDPDWLLERLVETALRRQH